MKKTENCCLPARSLALTPALQEFHPYVFQIFAQLIELRPVVPGVPLPAVYMAIFGPLLTPVYWERSGNVPALTRLLQVRMHGQHPRLAGTLHAPWHPPHPIPFPSLSPMLRLHSTPSRTAVCCAPPPTRRRTWPRRARRSRLVAT